MPYKATSVNFTISVYLFSINLFIIYVVWGVMEKTVGIFW